LYASITKSILFIAILLCSRHDIHNIKAQFNISSVPDSTSGGSNVQDSCERRIQPMELVEPAKPDSAVDVMLAPGTAEVGRLRRALVSKCQELVRVAAVCDDVAALQSALVHLTAADMNLRAIAGGQRGSLPTVPKLPASTMLDVQRHFGSAKRKCHPVAKRLRKPTSSGITNETVVSSPRHVEQSASHSAHNCSTDSAAPKSVRLGLSPNSSCGHIPYCVGSIDV